VGRSNADYRNRCRHIVRIVALYYGRVRNGA